MSITHIAFYPSDWLAGTRSLTAEETGVYITLICCMYEMAGTIERDDERLFRLCGCKSKKTFVKTLDYLIAEGKIEQVENTLFNERTQKEIKKIVEKSSKASDAAHSRWRKKTNKINGRGYADACQTHMHQRCQPEPEPEPLDKDKESLSKYMCDFDEFWNEYPHRKGSQNKAAAQKKFIALRKQGISQTDLLSGAKKYYEHCSETEQVSTPFVCMASTWLNQGRWEDEF